MNQSEPQKQQQVWQPRQGMIAKSIAGLILILILGGLMAMLFLPM